MSHLLFSCGEWQCAHYHGYPKCLSEIVSVVLDSDHLPIIFHIQNHVTIKTPSDPIETFMDWEQFQSLASYVVPPKNQINSGIEADKAMHDFTASIDPVCRLSTSKITVSDLNKEVRGLDNLLKHKQSFRKLWHKTQDTTRKMIVKWVTKTLK